MSSRLFLVETMALVEQDKDLPSRSMASNGPFVIFAEYLRNARSYILARHGLRSFRKQHGYRQEEGLGPVAHQVEGQTRALELSRVEILVSVLYLVITALDSLTRRRQLNRTAGWLRGDLPEPSYTASVFILCHVSFYYILGVEMPHSSRVAGIVSLHSLAQYLIPRSCASSHIEGGLETQVPSRAIKTEDSCIGTPS
jgi:hypothetical protein